ncbi:GIY-YIG nuclease family protein [Phyllobacterium sp. CCNWLW109]|uniref:GIY-YIG nuclease family protein n=1 Tax=Phyllobacterium sp. CCNWLW109 TaxID=3127479 RepID=UPI003076B445
MSSHVARSVRLHLTEGTPQGILTAEVVNWTGHVLSAPRSKLAGLLQRPEVAKSGVYFLVGPDADGSGRNSAYIGQSENVGKRLAQHSRDERKVFWEQTCIVTSKDPNLTSGHIKYIESRLISISARSGLVALTNDTAPEASNLPEADIADMEYFISQLRLVLPLLGLGFLREAATITSPPSTISAVSEALENRSPVFEISSKTHSLLALGQEVDGQFIVQAGSACRSAWEGSPHHNYRNLRNTLAEQGKIGQGPTTGRMVFLEDVSFTSPSAAAAMIFGRASNGRTAWKVRGQPTTYHDWQINSLPRTDTLEQ